MPGGDASRPAGRCLLAAVAFLGVAQAAFLPPFEGFDETAHYSSIQQIADEGQIPRPGVDKLSRDVEAYPGPLPADAPAASGSDRSYRAFFAAGVRTLPSSVARSFQAGTAANGESQQPPLYYLLMVPFYRLAQDWSWQGNLLLLRLVSWSMAFAGFAIGGLATRRMLEAMGASRSLALLPLAWPLLFPEFFPDMVRLGNDSLCLLLMGMAWASLLRLLEDLGRGSALWLGFILGLGLLTKAIFVPIGAGILVLLLFAAWRRPQKGRLAAAVAVATLAVLIGGGWYLHNLLVEGSLTGVNILVGLEEQGGVWSLLSQRFSLPVLLHMLRGLAVLAVSFVWVGTWSRAILPPILAAPVILLAAWPMALWLRWLGRGPIEAAAPLFVALPVLLGLIYQNLAINLLVEAGAGTGGWYLHILAAPLSFALALGWRRPRLFRPLIIYALLFHVGCWAAQLSFFSGCAYKPTAHGALRLDPGSCLIMPSHLAVLGEPMLGAAALLAAVILGGFALSTIIGRDRPAAGRSSPTGIR